MPSRNRSLAALSFEGSGTEADPYQIPNTEMWNYLKEKVSKGVNYSGRFFRQTANISVTTMVGSSTWDGVPSRPFSGTYDGDGHTMTVAISGYNSTAPFSSTNGATIKNLHIAGTLSTSGRYAGGIIGYTYGANTILNCRSSVEITGSSGDGSHGGLVGRVYGADRALNEPVEDVIIEGCIFDGKLLGNYTTNCGGLVGWCSNDRNLTMYLRNCVFAPQQLAMKEGHVTFIRAFHINEVSFTNCYFTKAFGEKQGKQAYSVAAGTGVTMDISGTPSAVYNVSGLSFYGTDGFSLNGVRYGGNGDAISLNLSGSSTGMYEAIDGTLTGSSNPYTLTMSNSNVTIAIPSALVLTANEDPQHAGVYYSTLYYSDFAFALPAGVEAYVATISDNDLLLTKIAVAGQTIPADNAVIFKANAQNFTLTPSDETPVSFSVANSLQGTDVAIATPANCYVLSGKSGVGFYQYNGSNLNPHKAYVILNNSSAPQRMRFIFAEEQNATGTENASADNDESQKRMENGRLVVIKSGVRYNAQGQIVK